MLIVFVGAGWCGGGVYRGTSKIIVLIIFAGAGWGWYMGAPWKIIVLIIFVRAGWVCVCGGPAQHAQH